VFEFENSICQWNLQITNTWRSTVSNKEYVYYITYLVVVVMTMKEWLLSENLGKQKGKFQLISTRLHVRISFYCSNPLTPVSAKWHATYRFYCLTPDSVTHQWQGVTTSKKLCPHLKMVKVFTLLQWQTTQSEVQRTISPY